MTDELTALRTFRAALAEPAPEALARVRARLDLRTEGDGRPGRGRGRGRLVPAVAAAAVLAVGAGLVSLNLAEEPPPPATHSAAVALLERLAAEAEQGPPPLTVPAGKVLYVHCRITYASRPGSPAPPDLTPSSGPGGLLVRQPGVLDRWYDVQGMITLMTRGTPGGPDNPDLDATIANVERDQFAKLGPNLVRPTPDFLAGLPTDRDAMLAVLLALIGTSPSWGEAPMTSMIYDLFHTSEPLLPPRVRAALYRALAKLDSVVATGRRIDVDGHQVYAVAQQDGNSRNELLLDAATGRVFGNRWISDETEPEPNIYKACTSAVVNRPGDTG